MKLKKMLSLAISVIMLLSVFSTASYAENNPTLDENTYIASDGTYVHTFNNENDFVDTPTNIKPEASSETNSNESIIGDDTRKKVNDTSVFPYSACVRIECTYADGSAYWGSGNVIGRYCILTAAHLVYNGNNEYPTKIVVKPSFNGTTYNTVYEYNVVRSLIYPGYVEAYDANYDDIKYDMAILCVDNPVGDVTGTFGYSTDVSVGELLTLTGYPGDKIDRGLYTDTKTAFSVTDTNLFYTLDTYGGQSGSGVYNSSNCIVAVHTNGGVTYNLGVRINSDKKAWIDKYNNSNPVYRLCNPNSGEHFYTISVSEKSNLIDLGWNYESVGWYAPTSGTPIYRLYNSNGGEHFYTANTSEINNLVSLGWVVEGIGFYTDSSCTVNVYRMYNPSMVSNNHLFTANIGEVNNLVSSGWNNEGVAWTAVA